MGGRHGRTIHLLLRNGWWQRARWTLLSCQYLLLRVALCFMLPHLFYLRFPQILCLLRGLPCVVGTTKREESGLHYTPNCTAGVGQPCWVYRLHFENGLREWFALCVWHTVRSDGRNPRPRAAAVG